MTLWKCCSQYTNKFGKLSSVYWTGKVATVSFQSQWRQCQNMFKVPNYHTTALISHTSKLMLKILHAMLQEYMNWALPYAHIGFRKFRGTRDQIANICWNIEKQENSRRASTSASLTMLNPLTVWITTNCGKFIKRWEYHTTLPASWETWMQVKKQHLELDMDQGSVSILGKWYTKAVCCHPAYLTYRQSVSCKMLGCWTTSWDLVCWEKYQ